MKLDMSDNIDISLYSDLCDIDIDELNIIPVDKRIEYCKLKLMNHNNYSILSGRLEIENIKKSLLGKTFSECMTNCVSVLDEKFYDFVMENSYNLNSMYVPSRDYTFNSYSINILKKSYLIILNGKNIMELPGYMYLRIAIFLHMPNMYMIKKVYDELSTKLYCHASSTMFNCGMKYHQLSSCFLLSSDDDIKSIGCNITNMMYISKHSGGIGHCVSNLRHSAINNQYDGNGIIPWIQIHNAVIKAVNQGGKRNGSCAEYLEPWHIDIFEFISAKREDIGDNSKLASYLFYGLMINDIFIKRVKDDEKWTLFCPHLAENLVSTYGKEFEEIYERYERLFENGDIKGRRCKAMDLWKYILDTITLTGSPYILFKDTINEKSNQKNLGTIITSNLCTEIVEYVDKDNIASCNLASICLPTIYIKNGNKINYSKLEYITRQLVRNLNKVIDRTMYFPDIPQIENSNKRDRSIAIGVQGFADLILLLDYHWECDEIKEINHKIFECIYYSALSESNIISIELGKSYGSFISSPISMGLFQFDLCGEPIEKWEYKPVYDWDNLRSNIIKYGLYNSLVTANMPTASTSRICNNSECFEPISGNVYSIKILAGTFLMINKYLEQDLKDIGIYTQDTLDNIISSRDSLENLISEHDTERLNYLKLKYKTSYEIPSKIIIDLASDRGKFIDQSQSMNIYFHSPDVNRLHTVLLYAHSKGLKTGMYYFRTKPIIFPINIYKKKICTMCCE